MDPEQEGNDKERSRDDRLLVWERAIQTQMHFAELSIKTRQIGMTVVGATLGLAIVLHRGGPPVFAVKVGGVEFPISSILCWAAALVLYAIRMLDVGVYHRMLRGAVAFNEDFERRNLLHIFGTTRGLTQAISHFSRHPRAKYQNGEYLPQDEPPWYAGDRISRFYWLLIAALVGAGIALFAAGVS